jgi:hypothetical protein
MQLQNDMAHECPGQERTHIFPGVHGVCRQALRLDERARIGKRKTSEEEKIRLHDNMPATPHFRLSRAGRT